MAKIPVSATCILLLILYPSPVQSEIKLTYMAHKGILVENESFMLQCIVTGTSSDLGGLTVMWYRPVEGSSSELPIALNDDSRTITVTGSSTMIISRLTVKRAPYFSEQKHYLCSAKNSQQSFPINVIKANNVPKLKPLNDLEPVKFESTVVLNCSVVFSNDNFGKSEFDVELAWLNNGKLLKNVTTKYKFGINNTLENTYSFSIKSFKDGGSYVCRWKLLEPNNKDFISENSTINLSISPYLNGPEVKEVKDTAGSDVKLYCDVVGFPITYEWREEESDILIERNSRFHPMENVLKINDIDYEDRKRYLCKGILGNDTLKQVIILRVKDPLAALWPSIGIIAEAVVVAAAILLGECYERKQKSNDDAQTKTKLNEHPSTSQT